MEISASVNSENPSSNQNETEPFSLSKQLYNYLKINHFEEAIKLLKNPKHESYLKHNSLDFVPIISRVLDEEFCTFETEECIEQILCYIASIANQKESLLVFLEEVEIFRSAKQFKVMLKPLQVILLKEVSTNTKSNIFSWIFTTLYTHISTLPKPMHDYLEKEERKLLDADPQQQDIVDCLTYLRDFHQVFYEKVMNEKLIWPNKGMKSGEYLSYFFLSFFHDPFSILDIYKRDGEAESNLYVICKQYVVMISNLVCNPFKYFRHIKNQKTTQKNRKCLVGEKEDEEEEVDRAPDVVSNLSLAVYFYCLFGQYMNNGDFPHVYSNEYLFYQLIPLYFTLFEKKNHFAVHKGLALLDSILIKLPENFLPQISLEIPNHTNLITILVNIMAHNPSEECRILALKCFKEWICKFDCAGRYRIFNIIFSTVHHPGVLGVVIHEVKENIRLSCKNTHTGEFFCNIKLQNLLKIICILPDGEITDLLEWSDKIMGALNLLIFICLYDQDNFTNFQPVLPHISKEFLEPLENGLRISKGHYELRLKELESNHFKEPDLNVEVLGDDLQGLPKEKQKEVVIQCVNWFDIMFSTWARANKLVNNTFRSIKNI